MKGDTLDVSDLPAPAICPRCFDTSTRHPLCRTDARMEANEDEADRRMARGDRWVTTLGIGGDQ